MGIASEFLEDDDLLLVVWDGVVSGAEWEALVARLMAEDPNWPPGKRRLVDITSLDPTALSAADVEAVVAMYRDRSASIVGTRAAIVASRAWDLATEFERGIDRLGSTTVVFNFLAEACGWLGVDADVAREAIDRLRTGLRTP